MTNETQPIRADLADLANNAQTLTTDTPDKTQETPAQANRRLAASLDRVRGEAVQRAKTANTRLRKQAFGATTLCFALGACLGFLLSRKRCKV